MFVNNITLTKWYTYIKEEKIRKKFRNEIKAMIEDKKEEKKRRTRKNWEREEGEEEEEGGRKRE